MRIALLMVAVLASFSAMGCRRRCGGGGFVPDGGTPVGDGREASCDPGELISIGCSDAIGCECRGDPTLTVCDATLEPESCVNGSPAMIAFNDDGGDGLCPQLSVTCPPSGRIVINPQPYGSGTYECDFSVEPGGL